MFFTSQFALLSLLGVALAAPLDASRQLVNREAASSCTNDLGNKNFLLGIDDGTTVNPQGTVVADPESGDSFKVLGVRPNNPLFTYLDFQPIIRFTDVRDSPQRSFPNIIWIEKRHPNPIVQLRGCHP